MPPGWNTTPGQLIYTELASWFHLLTAPEDYREETAFYIRILEEIGIIPMRTVLEMGSGGGNNAYHMKARFKLTLTDLSEDMLDISRKINPECEHIQGDMRNLRLNRQFDGIFIHDAIDYITSEKDLLKAFNTAFIHCKAGGAALFCPDYISETFKESIETGGRDKGERGLRYLDWTWDPDNKRKSFISHFVIIIRTGEKVEYCFDEHRCGLFPEQIWFDLMSKAGFKNLKAIPHPASDKWDTPVFAGIKPE